MCRELHTYVTIWPCACVYLCVVTTNTAALALSTVFVCFKCVDFETQMF